MEEENLEIKLIETIDTNIISVRDTIAIRDLDRLLTQAMERIDKTGAVIAGDPFAIYHSPEFNPKSADVEAGYPVSVNSDHTGMLKGCTCAAAVHKGDYAALHDTYLKIGGWIGIQGYTISGPPYEIYLNSPHKVKPGDLLTEVYFPIEKS